MLEKWKLKLKLWKLKRQVSREKKAAQAANSSSGISSRRRRGFIRASLFLLFFILIIAGYFRLSSTDHTQESSAQINEDAGGSTVQMNGNAGGSNVQMNGNGGDGSAQMGGNVGDGSEGLTGSAQDNSLSSGNIVSSGDAVPSENDIPSGNIASDADSENPKEEWADETLADQDSLLSGTVSSAEEGNPEAVPDDGTPEENEEYLHVWFLDVGEADCIVLKQGGHAMLVDAGNADDAELVLNFLSSQGITELEQVWFSHPHEDHIGSGADILLNLQVDQVFMREDENDTVSYRRLMSAIEEKEIPWIVPQAGEQFTFGDCTILVLGPVITSEEDMNANSLVLKVVYGNTSFLLTGDASREEEETILDSGADVTCNVLKVAHHGSGTSTSYRFLWNTWAQAAVISVGADNDYGHPHEEVLSRLSDADMSVYRTDLQGTVLAVSDGEKISFFLNQ